MNSVAKSFSRINWHGLFWPIIAILMGSPMFCIGLSEAYKSAQITRTFVATEGTVVDNVFRPFAYNGAAYVPVVEFQTHDGQGVHFEDGIGTYPPEYEVGTLVSVLYDPKDVQNAQVNSWKRVWFAPTLITSIGMLPILIGIVWGWVMMRKGVL